LQAKTRSRVKHGRGEGGRRGMDIISRRAGIDIARAVAGHLRIANVTAEGRASRAQNAHIVRCAGAIARRSAAWLPCRAALYNMAQTSQRWLSRSRIVSGVCTAHRAYSAQWALALSGIICRAVIALLCHKCTNAAVRSSTAARNIAGAHPRCSNVDEHWWHHHRIDRLASASC